MTTTMGNSVDTRVARGTAGAMLRALRARDYMFTVLDAEQHDPNYIRIRLRGNGFLRENTPYPTMWVRLWFHNPNDGGKGHQRAFTLVDPDAEEDTFWLEFARHEGPAISWAEHAQPGDSIEASLYGSEPSLPERSQLQAHVLVGDLASLPAINSLLDALGPAPAYVILEAQRDTDVTAQINTRAQDRVTWVRRTAGGETVLAATQAVVDELVAPLPTGLPSLSRVARRQVSDPGVFAWGACDTVTTRALTKLFRDAGLPKRSIKTLGYWLPPKDTAKAS